jgi:hypothetical protein
MEALRAHALQTWSPERLGYPTQKPVALLERIIKASSNPGDVVLDPFCGCGTTLHAAQNQGRHWIGLDISPTACGVMQRQLARIGQSVKIVGLPMTVDDLRALKPFEFQNWVIGRINGTHSPRKSGDMGIDGHTFFTHDPVQVKQSEGIGRNVVDNFETAIGRDRRQKGYIVALSFGRGAREEVARAKAHEGLDIELVEVQDLLDGTHPLAQNESTIFGAELAPVVPRDVATLPTIDELALSEWGREVARGLARAAEEPAPYGLEESEHGLDMRASRAGRRSSGSFRPERRSAGSSGWSSPSRTTNGRTVGATSGPRPWRRSTPSSSTRRWARRC